MTPDYFTHMPLLSAVASISSGPILELGCGWGSTPWLHGLCLSTGRKLVTLEGNPDWMRSFGALAVPGHEFRHVTDWKNLPEYEQEWGVVFVDHGVAADRETSTRAVKDKADYVVCHDSCYAPLYGYHRVFPEFTHEYEFSRWRPFTTVLSMRHELGFLRSI